MGIGGLSSYVSQRSADYLREYRLCNTELVIDGQNIASEIYGRNCDCFFGGDYATFSKHVSEFFDKLLYCGVTPVVVMDGGTDEEKISYYDQEMENNIRTISNLAGKKKIRILPICLYETFIQVAREKNIRCVQALFDADAETAYVARLLDCPVLSLDSDFYIHDVSFINFNTFGSLSSNFNGTSFQSCKIYKIDHVIERFSHLQRETLALIAIFFGNDYVDKSEFKNFTYSIMYSNQLNNNEPNDNKFDNVLNWLQNHTLDSALSKILSVYNQNERQTKIKIIEKVINKYLLLSSTVLDSLGFSKDEISNILRDKSDKPLKFSASNDLESGNTSKSDLNSNEKISCDYLLDEREKIDKIHKMAPTWFMQRFHSARIPGLWINTLIRIPLKLQVQIEDISHPGCMLISFKIMRVIFKLLNTGTSDSNTLTFFTRGKSNQIEFYELDCSNIDVPIPRLESIISLDIAQRKKVLIDTAGVSESFLVKFPPEWRVFMAALKYWKKEADDIFTTKCHLYALIFIMISDFTMKFMQKQRGNYNRNFNSNNDEYNNFSSESSSIMKILQKIESFELKKITNFFERHSKIDKSELNISVIHAFSLFQNILRNIMHLNALLNYPYPDVKIFKFYDSSLIYNLHCTFNKCRDVENYLKNQFSMASNLYELFYSILDSINSN